MKKSSRMFKTSSTPYKELTNAVWLELFGSSWSSLPHQRLDFSSEAFNLGSLEGINGGLLNPELNLRRLVELNLHKNDLIDIENVFTTEAPFARCLNTLILSKNLLTRATIDLPALKVLDLSFNRLTSYPELDYLPNLEVLQLANNCISCIWSTIGKCPKLTSLDISSNRISFLPSQLEWGIQYLARCPRLTSFACRANPFSTWFPEHVYVFATHLPQLHTLDSIDLSGVKTSKTEVFPLKSLVTYDAVYERRRIYQDAIATFDKAEQYGFMLELEEIPSISFFIAEFNKALETTDDAIHWCNLVSRAADLLYNAPPSQGVRFFPSTLAATNPSFNQSKQNDSMKETIALFLQNLMLLIERHEATRPIILRALARFGCVSDYNFGLQCLICLYDYIMSNENVHSLAINCFAESLIPCIREKTYKDIRCRTVLQGIARMKGLNILAESLSPCMLDIADFLEEEPMDPVLISVMSLLVEFKPNAIEAFGQGIPRLVVEAFVQFQNKTLEANKFIDYLHIASCCASAVPRAAKYFVSISLHLNFVFTNLKDHFRDRETYKWNLEKAAIVAAMIDFLSGIMKQDEQTMVDCVDHYHLTDLLLVAIKEHVADPLVLASSCRGLLVIMSDASRQNVLLEYITEQAGRFECLLQYLGGQTYKDLCIKADKHSGSVDTISVGAVIPDAASNLNPYVHDCFCSILEIFLFFLKNAFLPYCAIINQYLGEKKRERCLFKLLLTPNNHTKFCVVSCLAHIPIENFTEKNVITLLDFLKNFRAFSLDEAASIVVVVLNILQRFIDDIDGKPGQLIRRIHVEKTFDAVYELLYQALRLSHTSSESFTMQTSICTGCCNFLRGASYHVALRPFMREGFHKRRFTAILKAEEERTTPYSQDVAIERCWTGRDVTVLMQLFTRFERLDPLRRVAFRSVSQLADVLEGRSAFLDMAKEIHVVDLAQREENFFDESNVRKQLAILDSHESKDRIIQQKAFIEMRGPEKLLGFMSPLMSEDFGIHLAMEKKARKDSEYWAGRFKAIREDMDKDLAAGQPIDETYGLTTELEFFDIPPRIQNKTRWTLFEAFHKTANSQDRHLNCLYFRYDTGLYGTRSLWRNPMTGEMRRAIILSAFLRCFYSCLIVPVSNDVLSSVKAICRRPTTVRNFVALLETVPLLDCHVGAKFFLLIRLVITLEPHQAAESMDLIILYSILSRVIQRLVYPLQSLVLKGSVQPLGLQEQIFATEICALMSVIISQTSWIKFSTNTRVQRWAIMYSFKNFLGEDSFSFLNIFAELILYDQLVSAGSARGTFVEHLFQSTAENRENMRMGCLVILSVIVQRCDTLKYEALEILNRTQIFQDRPVRKSFIFELLEAANMGHYVQALQHHLSVKEQRAERVLHSPILHRWTPEREDENPSQMVYALTNYNTYCIEKPEGIRNFQAGASHTSMQNAKSPNILECSPYSTMTRLVRGFPSNQVIIVCRSNPTNTFDVSVEKETYEILICDTLFSTLPLLQTLQHLSGATLEKRVNVYSDVVFRQCLKQHIVLKEILIATFVLRLDSEGRKLFVFHVLTSSTFFEFSVKWKYWFPPYSELAYPTSCYCFEDSSSCDDSDDSLSAVQQPQELDNFLGFIEKNHKGSKNFSCFSYSTKQRVTQDPPNVLDVFRAHHEGSGEMKEEEKKRLKQNFREKVKIAKKYFLKVSMKQGLDHICAITFSDGEEPRTTYTFTRRSQGSNSSKAPEGDKASETIQSKKKKVTVVYLDDCARERWKRLLAGALNQLEASRHWRRHWNTSSKSS